jgi:hypothetical protein
MTAAPDIEAGTSDIIDAMEDERLRDLARYVFELRLDIDGLINNMYDDEGELR